MAKKITQATFDAAVTENRDEFDMSPEQALADAITQFESQGVDLAGIIKELPGEEGRLAEFHKLATLVDSGATADAILPVLGSVSAKLANKDVAVFAGQQNALPLLIKAVTHLAAQGSPAGVAEAFVGMGRLLDGQPDLLAPPPGQITEDIIVMDLPPNAGTQALSAVVKQYVDDAAVVAAGLYAVVRACIKHEVNRQAFVDNGIVIAVMETLRKHGDKAEPAAAAAECLRALTLDDDVRVPFGKAHSNARMIVAECNGLGLLVASLRSLQSDPSAVPSLANAVSRLAVRNEFCQEIVDLGGVAAALEAMSTHSTAAAVQQACCSLLRAVAGNDLVKTHISECGGIDAVVMAIQTHVKVAGVVEQGCAALAALCLRNENNSRTVVVVGGPSAVVNGMQIHAANLRVQRQACQALRNMVARTPELRDAILGNGAESFIRAAMETHPGCMDVAKGALRDLGCKVDLKELWTGTAGLGASEDSQPIDD